MVERLHQGRHSSLFGQNTARSHRLTQAIYIIKHVSKFSNIFLIPIYYVPI